MDAGCRSGVVRGLATRSAGGKMPLNDASVSIAPAIAMIRRKSSNHATSICPRIPSDPGIGDHSSSSPRTNQSPVKTNAVRAERYVMRRIIEKIVSHRQP
jgi:hypothetical protein